MLDSPLVLPAPNLYTLDRISRASHGVQFRGPRESAGFRVSGAPNSIYVAYLDEFGHVGPFISRTHELHNTSPVFGFGGIVLPLQRVRSFASFFYRLKCNLLAYEIGRAGVPPYQWEKKGASLYTTRNVLKYAELRHATARLLNRIKRDQGMVFYVGVEKARSPDEHDAKQLYQTLLTEAIGRLDDFCDRCGSSFIAVLDEHRDRRAREELVAAVSSEMFGASRLACLIEPPIQAESHLFQTLQCADWICGLVGRAGCHLVAPEEYGDLEWVPKYFSQRLAGVAPISSIDRHVAEGGTAHQNQCENAAASPSGSRSIQ
jgi:ribosomal protein S27AE